jgi:hypothetical protein
LRRELRELFEIALVAGRRDGHQHAGGFLADICELCGAPGGMNR